VARHLEGRDPGYDPALWQEMARRGWLGLTIPSVYGGGDGRFLDLSLLYEEMGRFLVPSPHLDSVALCGELVLATGSEPQKRRVLPEVAAGRCVVSVATLEPSGTFGPSGLATTAPPQNGSFGLSGTKLLAAFAGTADYILLTARGEGGGVTMLLVDARSRGITCTPLDNLAGGALYQVDCNEVSVPGDAVIGAVGDGWAAFSTAATEAAVLQTATIVGAARAVLDMTNQYAKDYGKKAAAHPHRQAHEVHAGVGFMVEHDLQLFSRRSKFWENNLGDARYHQQQLAAALRLMSARG
jgi:alkylation response protein AidB-like acyl-CoA dehydrogenase